MMHDKRPKNVLSDPNDPWGTKKVSILIHISKFQVFDAEDAYLLSLKEKKLQKKHLELKKLIKEVKREQAYLKEKEYFLELKETELRRLGADLRGMPVRKLSEVSDEEVERQEGGFRSPK